MSPSTRLSPTSLSKVTTTAVDAKNNLVGFQGDFTFDERVVTFHGEPVQKAGITGGNWNVSRNVSAWSGADQDAAHIGLLERFRAALRGGNAVRTEDDQGEQGNSRHATNLGGVTGPVHLHRCRTEHADAHQRSAWQRHPIGEAQVKPAPPTKTGAAASSCPYWGLYAMLKWCLWMNHHSRNNAAI